jgi:hypothetical protein
MRVTKWRKNETRRLAQGRLHGGNSSKTWAAGHKLDMVGASPTSCLFAIEGVIE